MSISTLEKIDCIINSESEFLRYASALADEAYTHLPIVREMLADLDTPVSTYLKLANQPYTYLFESVEGGNKWGRYSIIGLPCNTVYRFTDKQCETEINGESHSTTVDDPLQTVRELQAQFKVACYAGLPDMIGGLVGYFGYATIGFIEPRLAAQFAAKVQQGTEPDIMLMVSTDVLVFDNLAGRVFMVTLADIQVDDLTQSYQAAQQRLDSCVNNLTTHMIAHSIQPAVQKSSANADSSAAEYQTHFEQTAYQAAVQKCRDYIGAGDIMQVVLSQRLSIPFAGASIDVYRALRTINPSPYMYFLNMGDFEIVGSSPEILVRLNGDRVTVRPIAGTRKRGQTTEQDIALEQELANDEKELAEHLMLIDLGRNDVGRIAQIGTVALTEKMLIERYSHVMHIVSNVNGQIRPELDAIDVLKATFPAGTVSGAPKIRAMQIIHECEPTKRGVYSGAVGYLGWNGNMDTAIAIRTAVIRDGELSIQAGAGIVADSVPEYEWQETLSKARAIFKAVDMANSGMGLPSSTPNERGV